MRPPWAILLQEFEKHPARYAPQGREQTALHLKRMLTTAVLFAALMLFALPCAAAGPDGITSEAYLVACADTGQVLIQKNAAEALEPASVTKIMTLGLACEKAQGDWSVQLTVSHDDVHSLYGTDSSHIALQEGEVLTLEQLLYATEISSANDAANVLAEYVGGSIQGGVDAMNAKAAELGLVNTHFANPHGISATDHYTCAADLAVILRWAMQQPGFSTLFSRTEYYPMPATNLQPNERAFWLQDKMRISGNSHCIPTITGSKIGYTNSVRYTYACTAEQDGVRLICIVLKSNMVTEKYADVGNLLSYSFSHFRAVTVSGTALPAITVKGGGAAIGTIQGSAPAYTVLLDSALDESAVSCTAPDATYLLGGSLPTVTYTVSGGGVQEDAAVTVPVSLQGLAELLAAHKGDRLAASLAAHKAAAGGRILAWVLGLGCALCLVLLWLRQNRRQRRRAARKPVAKPREIGYDIRNRDTIYKPEGSDVREAPGRADMGRKDWKHL